MDCVLTREADAGYFTLELDWLGSVRTIEAALIDVVVNPLWRPHVSVLLDLRRCGDFTLSDEDVDRLVRVHHSIEGLMGGVTSGPRYALLTRPGSAHEGARAFRDRANGLHADVEAFTDDADAREWVAEAPVSVSGEYRLGPLTITPQSSAAVAQVIPLRKNTG